MALADKEYSSIHDKTGSDLLALKAKFDDGHINTLLDLADNETNPEFGALLYQIQKMQDDLDEIRRYLTAEVGDGAKGDKGDTGSTGAQGPKGDTGATGATGPAQTDASQLDGSTLPTSSKGLKSGELWNNKGIVSVA